MGIAVAFTWEYSKVSISTWNEKCTNPELIRSGDMTTKDNQTRGDLGRDGIN
jgi:hypothetical protein